MTRSRVAAWVFCAVAAVQVAVPASRVVCYERTLREGKVFKLRTAPVDPEDAFRGRYVALSYETAVVPWVGGGEAPVGGAAYARLATQPDGFAKLVDATRDPPTNGDFLRVRVRYDTDGGARVGIAPEFDRFYMDENLAPGAERAYTAHNLRGGTRDAYVTVRVLDGVGVIEQVWLGDQTLAEAARASAR